MSDPDYPFEFACRRSGNCCSRPGGFVRVGDDDVAAIAGHLGLSVAAVRSRFVDASRQVLKNASGGGCVFLEDGATTACAIHPVRPAKCRTWPFWPELLESGDALRAAVRLCPGITLRSR